MVFSSLTFLFVVSAAVAGGSTTPAEPRPERGGAGASLFFYAWGAPRFVLVLARRGWWITR
jgi:hypothetical protein